jgi:hypothetical protein
MRVRVPYGIWARMDLAETVFGARQEIKRRWRRINRGNTTTSKSEDMVEVVRIFGIERGQDGKCATRWHLYGVKIGLLFQCRYPE